LQHQNHIVDTNKKVKRNPFTLIEYITISKAVWKSRAVAKPVSDRRKGEKGKRYDEEEKETFNTARNYGTV
jgi:hypothetical protein